MPNQVTRMAGMAGALCISASVACAQVLLDGDFNALTAGSAPDCNQSAGAWHWPGAYALAGLCEQWPEQFQVVMTSTFDPGAIGNSLEMNVVNAPQNATFQLPNIFARPVQESVGHRAIVQFDVWVPQPGIKGGYIYIGGDQGGAGFNELTDRGPQLGWQPGGALTRSAANLELGPIPLLLNYPNSQWQTLRLSIDLITDRYDIWWGPQGSPTMLLDMNAPFHNGNALTHLDRFTIGHLVKNAVDAHMYLDNVVVHVEPIAPPTALNLHGDFDSLPVGTGPDCGQFTGSWGWPGLYTAAGVCETSPAQFGVVPTSTFQAGAVGNSLHLNVVNASPGQESYHLPNLFTQMVQERADELVIVEFQVWVPQPGVKGGNIYVGGNHGNGGFGNVLDRGPQLGWQSDGSLTRSTTSGPVVVVQRYPVAAWQDVRLVIDLVNDSYDIWWSLASQPLTQVAANAPFQNGALLDHLDRFTVAHFSSTGTTSQMYIDNLRVEVIPDRLGDINADGAVNVIDLLSIINAWGVCSDPPAPCPADIAPPPNGDGFVNVGDLLIVINNWG